MISLSCQFDGHFCRPPSHPAFLLNLHFLTHFIDDRCPDWALHHDGIAFLNRSLNVTGSSFASPGQFLLFMPVVKNEMTRAHNNPIADLAGVRKSNRGSQNQKQKDFLS
jgi:hypothetical protein